MSYKELFEEGRLGVKVFNSKECKEFITLYGEDPNKGEWKRVIEASEWFSIVFCICEDKLATTNGHDGDLVIIDYKNFMKESDKKIGYKKLFEQGKIGVEVTNLKECEEIIKLYRKDPNKTVCKDVIALLDWLPLVFCMYEDELGTTDENDETLEDIIDYEEFMEEFVEEFMEEMSYKELFELGKLGVKASNINETKSFIELWGENLQDSAWSSDLKKAKYEPIIFCIYEGLATTSEYDEDLVKIIDYKEFIKEIKEEELLNVCKLTDDLEDIATEVEVSEDKEEQVKLDCLNGEEKKILKESIESSIQYKQEQIEKLDQEITGMKILLSKIYKSM